MSLCHIWFGVERSNRRGGGCGFFRAFGGGAVSPVAFRCWRTVSGLAFRQNSRRRICEIRLAPCRGFSRLSAVIFSWTAPGRRGVGFLSFPSSSPASPCARYRRDQLQTALQLMPSSRATRSAGSASSR